MKMDGKPLYAAVNKVRPRDFSARERTRRAARQAEIDAAFERAVEAELGLVTDGTTLRSRATEAGSLPVASRDGEVIPRRCAGSNPAEGNLVGQSGSPPHGFRSHRERR